MAISSLPSRRGLVPAKPAAKPSIFARALALVGLERTGPRPQASVYRGVRPGRLTEDYFTRILSGDQEIKADFRRLRGTARALVRDNAMASRYCQLRVENVIGPHGIRLQARAVNSRGNLHDALNDKIEDAWKEWGKPENASVDGRMSWIDVQKFVEATLPQDGEILIRIIRGANNPFYFALQILDPDQLDDMYNVLPAGPDDNEIRMGVEIDRFGKPVQYWIWQSHPNDPRRGQKRVPVPASDIIHIYRQRRPGQTRGITDFAPVMFDTQMMQGFQEAEITAARMGASNMAAIQYDPEKGGDGGDDDDEREDGEIPMEVEPGLLLRLNPGESLVNTNFNHPNGAFAPFTKSIQRSIASGLNVSYSSLTGDLEAVNFSSIKAGMLGERDFYRSEQVWIVEQLHARVYREWAPYAALAGFFRASDARGTERILWQPRGWKSPDPLGDMQAAILGRRAGITTLTAVCGEQGTDFEENLEQIAEEDRLAREYGVTINLDTTATNRAPDVPDIASGSPSTDDMPPATEPAPGERPSNAPTTEAIPLRRRAK